MVTTALPKLIASTSLGKMRLALFADPPQFPEPLGRLKHPRSFKVEGPGNHFF